MDMLGLPLASGNPAYSHGTLCAGVLAGIAPDSLIMPLRVFDDQGQTELALEASAGWRRRELPFGVFLAPAALIALLFGDAIIGWYLRISGL